VSSEWPSWDQATELTVTEAAKQARIRAADEADRPQIDPVTPISELVRCHTTIVESEWGGCGRGELREKTDPLVVNLPE
jgi:hypothetical protein